MDGYRLQKLKIVPTLYVPGQGRTSDKAVQQLTQEANNNGIKDGYRLQV